MDEMKELVYASMIPKEMFWAYEAVRQSGLYNMCCIKMPMTSNNTSDRKEMLSIMDDCYIRYCVYNNADISKPEYKHITADHILLIQRLYNLLLESYGLTPKGICEIKKHVFPATVASITI